MKEMAPNLLAAESKNRKYKSSRCVVMLLFEFVEMKHTNCYFGEFDANFYLCYLCGRAEINYP